MFTVLFPPVGLVILTVRPPESLLVISAAIDVDVDALLLAESLLARLTVRAHTFRFLPLFVAVIVEPATALLLLLLDIVFIYSRMCALDRLRLNNRIMFLAQLQVCLVFPNLFLFQTMMTFVALLEEISFACLFYPNSANEVFYSVALFHIKCCNRRTTVRIIKVLVVSILNNIEESLVLAE